MHPVINDTTIELSIKDCPKPCPYSQFSTFKERWTNEQWDSYFNGDLISQPTANNIYKPIGGTRIFN